MFHDFRKVANQFPRQFLFILLLVSAHYQLILTLPNVKTTHDCYVTVDGMPCSTARVPMVYIFGLLHITPVTRTLAGVEASGYLLIILIRLTGLHLLFGEFLTFFINVIRHAK